MNVNVRLEEVMNLLDENEFVGKLGGTTVSETMWVFAKLTGDSFIDIKSASKSLSGLANQIEDLKR